MSKHKPASRRWQAALILTLFGIAVAAAAFGGWWYARESPPHQGPIVLVSVTGLGARELTAYGSTRSSSSAIDALAEDGEILMDSDGSQDCPTIICKFLIGSESSKSIMMCSFLC